MKKHLTKILALLLAVSVVFSLAACGGKNDDETTTAADGTTQAATEAGASVEDSTTADGTTIPGETTTEGSTEPGESTTAGSTVPGQTTTAAPVNKKPETPAEILAAYTAVMNKAKNDKPAYKKIEYQELPKDKRDIKKGGGVISLMLNLAGLFMKSKNDAEKEPENTSKNSDMKWFPVYKAFPGKVTSPGCLLTNTGAIKSAKCDVLSNGNYKITIVLNDEMNPEPYKEGQLKATSNHGNMFSPLARSEIDDTLKNDSKVNWALENPTFDLKYYNCTAELVYNPKNNRVVTLNQIMNVLVNIKEPTRLGPTKRTRIDILGSAVLVNTLKILDVKY